jgi:hypothetical protein
MTEFQISNLVYLLLLLAVIIYFTRNGYRGNLPQAVKHGAIWLAIILGFFVLLRLFGY